MSDPSGYFKPGQRKAIYNSCETLRDKVLIRVLWKSARRITEVLNLKVKDINFNEGNILWHIQKKYKTMGKDEKGKLITERIDLRRIKPIDDFTLRLLSAYIKQEGLKGEDYVFYGLQKSTHISRQRAYQLVARACDKAGINFVGESKPHPHHFRHTFAVNQMKNAKSPADLRKLQTFLEHSTITTTEAYMQFSTEESRELVEMDED